MEKNMKSIKVGANYYSIRKVPKSELPEDSGECDTETLTIKVRRGCNPDSFRTTLMHEVLHAINICFAEKDVEFLAQALTQVFVENPHLTKLFLKKSER